MKKFPALVLTLLLGANPVVAAYIELGPMLGHVDADSAAIWFKASAAAKPSIIYSTAADLSDRSIVRGKALEEERDFMGTINVGGLTASTRYYYAIELDGRIITPRPYPSLTTAPANGEPSKQRIVFSSCLGRDFHEPAAAWAQMAATSNADLVLLLGDNHYADTTAREGQVLAYFGHRALPGFLEISSRVPIYSIWDDHDFGPNDSDSTTLEKEIALETFKQFWPNPTYGEPDNPGIYYNFKRGEVEFFMLDVRYHRSPDTMIDDGTKTMLGERQLNWLKDRLKSSSAEVKIIASGSEWQLNGHTDSWNSYPREREDVFNFLRQENIRNVLLISGDRHFTGGYQIGGDFIEVTAGPLGGKNYPTEAYAEMFFIQNDGKLYAVFDIDTTVTPPAIELEVHRAGDGLVYKKAIPWAAVIGNEKFPTLPVEKTREQEPHMVPFGAPSAPAEQ